MKFETDYIEKLAKVLADTGLTEISLEDGEQAITLRKDVVVAPVAPVVSAPVQAAPAAQAQAPSAPAQAASEPAKKVLQLHLRWLELSTSHHHLTLMLSFQLVNQLKLVMLFVSLKL